MWFLILADINIRIKLRVLWGVDTSTTVQTITFIELSTFLIINSNRYFIPYSYYKGLERIAVDK